MKTFTRKLKLKAFSTFELLKLLYFRSDYFKLGTVTEFRYSQEISRSFSGNALLKWLGNFGESWGFHQSKYSLTFVDNHGL